MSATVDSELTTTRRSLHAVAEGLLAGPQYRATGTIRLAVRPGGFATSRAYGDFTLIAIEGTDLLVLRGDRPLRLPLTGTCGDLAAGAGLPVDRLDDVYPGSVRPEPSTRIEVDPNAAATLAAAWNLGDRALRAFGARVTGSPDPDPVLWPEHLDVAIAVDGSDYGVSPGDDVIPEPYAYVSSAAPRSGAFWNQPFGAARPLSDLPDQRAVVDFYRTGYAFAGQPR